MCDLYLYKGFRIEELPCFVYEILISKHWKNGYCVLDNKMIKSDSLIKLKYEIKYYKDYLIEKQIILIGAPHDFIVSNHLPIYTNKKPKKK